MAKLRSMAEKMNIRVLLVRIGIISLGIAALAALVYLAFLKAAPGLWELLKSGDEYAIAAYLGSQNSVSGMLCTALLAFLQPVSIVLPGAPIQIAAGVVYGTLKGFLICHSAYVFSNLVVFYLARVLRQRMEKYLTRYASKIGFLENARYPVYMTAMACLMPLMPNGIIPYAAARTKMRFYQFFLAVALGGFFPIMIMCAIGKRILHGEFLYAALLFAGSFAVVMILTWLREPICSVLDNLGQKIISILHRADPPQDE